MLLASSFLPCQSRFPGHPPRQKKQRGPRPSALREGLPFPPLFNGVADLENGGRPDLPRQSRIAAAGKTAENDDKRSNKDFDVGHTQRSPSAGFDRPIVVPHPLIDPIWSLEVQPASSTAIRPAVSKKKGRRMPALSR